MLTHIKQTFLLVILLVAITLASTAVYASSHREAPLITEMPKVDSTDFYMFRSFDPAVINDDFTTIIANFLPLQDPAGGPNFFFLDPEALYEIHIENSGDEEEDITFQFRFENEFRANEAVAGIEIPLVALAGVADREDANLNIVERYTINVVQGDRRQGEVTAVTNKTLGGTTFVKPLDNMGSNTIPDYNAYAQQHIFEINLPGGFTGKVFVGQRREGFIVELGGVFDTVNLDAANLNINNALRLKSITSIVIEVPTEFLTGGNTPTNADFPGVIGGWCSSSLRQARILNPNPQLQANNGTVEGGAFSQVSRLGMPLVNELLVGLSAKDTFSASEPKDDAQFEQFFLNSSLAALLGAQTTDRTDLRDAFFKGIAGLNQTGSDASMMRLNTTIDPVAYDDTGADRLGVLDGFTTGFPNGRRPSDDVVDIELQLVVGELIGNPNDTEDNAIANFTIGVYYLDTFPYLANPIAGDGLDYPDDSFE